MTPLPLHRFLFALIVAALLAPATADAAATAGWSATAGMSTPRNDAQAVVLNTGKVLVAGGFTPSAATSSVELYDPATGVWTPAASMATARGSFGMVKLRTGKVLVAGGASAATGAGATETATAELYDPGSDTWSTMPALATQRRGSSLTLLDSGKVLIAGGSAASTSVTSAQLFDPATLTWSAAGSLHGGRSGHAAVALPGGRALLAGGWISGGPFGVTWLASVERYEGGTAWTEVASMATPRDYLQLNILPSGRVLATAGGIFDRSHETTEVYDPVGNSWAAGPSLAAARWVHTATTLADGRILAAGGEGAPGSDRSAELYDPATNAWTPAGTMATGRTGHTATLLLDGRVLVAGGSTATAEVWTPPASLSTSAAPEFADQALGTTAVTTLTITNTANATLFAGDFELSGAQAGEFAVNADRCRAPVAPRAACTIDVRFTPAAEGPRAATLTFAANSAGGTHTVALSGRGFVPVAPKVNADPAPDTDRDGVADSGDRCGTLSGSAARQGCPAGLLNDPSIRYLRLKRGIKVLAYYVKATTGARIEVTCTKRACKRGVVTGRGAKPVRIKVLDGRRLANGTRITVTATMPGRLTTTVSDRVARARRSEGRPRCAAPGTTAPIGC